MGHQKIQIRLTKEEHQFLKRHAKPNVTTWLRAQLRQLPGGEALPALEKPASKPPSRPPWTPRAVIVGELPGNPALQVAAFVAAVQASTGKVSWKQWRPVHELYEGLRAVLATGHGLQSVWRDANAWDQRGRRPHANEALFAALFRFKATQTVWKRWYDQTYHVSAEKRQRAKDRNPEGFLAKQRESMRAYRAQHKQSEAVQLRLKHEQALVESFTAEHVTEHRPSPRRKRSGGEEARGVGPLNGRVAGGAIEAPEGRGPTEVPARLPRVAIPQQSNGPEPVA